MFLFIIQIHAILKLEYSLESFQFSPVLFGEDIEAQREETFEHEQVASGRVRIWILVLQVPTSTYMN